MNPASVTKLTIITVVYNDVKNIKQTLRSVIKLKKDPQRNFDISYIVIDGFGEWIWLLKHHSDARAQLHDIHARCINIFPVKQYLAFDAGACNGIVHPV